jgi:transposase InsO family protein
MAESFIKTFKRDYVHINELPDVMTVLEKLPEWFEDYNENHPHFGLKMMFPKEYIKLMSRVDECSVL